MACCEAAGGIDIFDLADTLGVDTHDLNQTEAMDEVESVLTKGQFTKKEFFDVLKGLGDLPDGVQEVLEQSLDDGEDPSLPVFKVPEETIRGLLESPGFYLASLAETCVHRRRQEKKGLGRKSKRPGFFSILGILYMRGLLNNLEVFNMATKSYGTFKYWDADTFKTAKCDHSLFRDSRQVAISRNWSYTYKGD